VIFQANVWKVTFLFLGPSTTSKKYFIKKSPNAGYIFQNRNTWWYTLRNEQQNIHNNQTFKLFITMNSFKNFIAFATLVFATVLCTAPSLQAQTAGAGGLKIQMQVEPSAAAYIKFDGIDGEIQVNEGRNVVGKNTRNGDQLIVVVRNGKPVQFGVQPVGGTFKAIPSNASPCNSTLHCTTLNPPVCFTLPGGQCVCSCGPWITSNTGRN
jgi:hypothetical protein